MRCVLTFFRVSLSAWCTLFDCDRNILFKNAAVASISRSNSETVIASRLTLRSAYTQVYMKLWAVVSVAGGPLYLLHLRFEIVGFFLKPTRAAESQSCYAGSGTPCMESKSARTSVSGLLMMFGSTFPSVSPIVLSVTPVVLSMVATSLLVPSNSGRCDRSPPNTCAGTFRSRSSLVLVYVLVHIFLMPNLPLVLLRNCTLSFGARPLR